MRWFYLLALHRRSSNRNLGKGLAQQAGDLFSKILQALMKAIRYAVENFEGFSRPQKSGNS